MGGKSNLPAEFLASGLKYVKSTAHSGHAPGVLLVLTSQHRNYLYGDIEYPDFALEDTGRVYRLSRDKGRRCNPFVLIVFRSSGTWLGGSIKRLRMLGADEPQRRTCHIFSRGVFEPFGQHNLNWSQPDA